MSLIKCPECGKEVSTKAPYCPNCGVPILHNVKRCPICNGVALMDAEQCPHCEARFIVQTEEAEPTGTTESSGNTRTSGNSEISGNAGNTGNAASTEPSSSSGLSMSPETSDSSDSSESSDTPAPPKPEKKSNAPWWLLILAILLVAVGGFFYYEHQQHEATEEKDYERLQNCTEKANFQDFINRYPESRHTDNVRARLDELERIDKEWSAACASADQLKLQHFIDQHPTSIYKAVALHKIDSLDWLEADRRGTAAAYALYIGRHENGEYIEQAFIARDEADRREAQARRDSIEAAQAAMRDSLAISDEGAPAAI